MRDSKSPTFQIINVWFNNNDKMKYKLFFIVLILSVLSSCNILPYLKYYTTTKDGKFPKFSKKEYLAGSNNEYRSCYDVTYYNLDIEVNPEKKYIKGSIDIYFKVKQNFDTLFLDLHRAFKLQSIILDDSINLNLKRKGNLVYLMFNQTLETGKLKKLKIYYEGKPPKLLGSGPIFWKKDSCDNHWISTKVEGFGTHLIMPCKYLLNDEPDSLRMNITVPKGLTAVCNGRLKNRKLLNNKESFEWFVNNPVNIYNISFNIGNFKHFEIPYTNNSGTHQLQFYVLPYHFDIAKDYFQQCIDILNYYESVYDEFPWWDDEFKIIESSFRIGSGMEHQSAITLGLSYRNNFFDYSGLLIHEISHEWWGNSVSIKDYGDMWLHEGFATYNELLFMEHKYGKYQYDHFINAYKKRVHNERPLVKPMNVLYNPFESPKDRDIYQKGALLLHTLRYSIDNDSLFFDILKTFYLKFKKNNIETSDFIDHVNKKTKQDYNWLFNQYLYNHKIPELHYFKEVEVIDSINKTTFYYQWMNTRAEFKLPVNIITNSDTIVLHPSLELKSIELEGIDTIYFDKNNGYIDIIEKITKPNNGKPKINKL